MKSKIIILSVVLALAFTSCLENKIVYNTDDVDMRLWEFAGTIAKIHAPLYKSIEKWMDFEEIFINNDGVICVNYTHYEKIKWDDDYFGIESISSPLDWGYDLPDIPIPGTEISDEISAIIQVRTAKTGTYITEAELASFNFNLSVDIPDNIIGSVTITIPQLKSQAGAVFTQSYNNLQGVNNLTASFINYKMETPDKELQIDFSFTVKSTGGGSTAGRLTVNDVSITDIKVDYMKGYFGQLDYDENIEMSFDFFNDLDFEGEVGIKDIVFEARVSNSVGAPLGVEVKGISFVNDDGDLTKIVETLSFEIPAATESGNNHAVTASNASRSGKLSDILFAKDNYPKGIVFDIWGILNPDGEGNNFVVKNEDLAEAQLTLTVPLHIKIEAYNRLDTIAFDYNDIIDNDEKFSNSIDNFVLKLKVDNNLPFAVKLSADAIDEEGNVVERNIVNENINAKQKDQPPIIIELNQPKLEKFRTMGVKNIILRTISQTASKDYVKVTKDDYIDIVVSTSFESSIPSNIFLINEL